jgi:hypothetical protein
MRTTTLDDEAEKYLEEILSQDATDSQQLIKELLFNYLNSLRQSTVLEKMGGYPKHLLEVGGLSERANRKKIISARIQDKHKNRHQ